MAAICEVIVLTQGDRLAGVQAILCDVVRAASGDKTLVPIDLTGSAVKFKMVNTSNQILVNADCSIDPEVTGRVTYDWQPGDTDAVGEHRASFVETKDGKDRHFPGGNNWIPVTIGAKPGA